MTVNLTINDLNIKQTEIVNKILSQSDCKYHLIRASRQSGKSFLLLRLSVYLALKEENKLIGFISYSHKQNRKNFRDLINILPTEVLRNKGDSDSNRYVEFINGTIVQFFSSINYDSIVGNSFDHLIGDEFALWRIVAWDMIRPTTAAKRNAKVILASTPRGKNHFYNLCIQGQSKDPFVSEYTMSYIDNASYDIREIENAKKTLPESVFKQEYLAMFIFGKSQVFGDFAKFQTVNKFEDPISGKKYYFAIDVSGSGEDTTVLTILDEDGNPVLIYEATNTNLNLQAIELLDVIRSYSARGVVECNGLGQGLFDIMTLVYPAVEKYWMTNESKQDIVTKMITSLASGNLQLPTAELCPKLDNEMSTYIVKRTQTNKLAYSHDDGLHDDYVDSFMMANWCRLTMLGPKFSVYETYQDIPQLRYPTTRDLIDLNNSYLDDNY